MKPAKRNCKHCELYPCKRTECQRKPAFNSNGMVMLEPKEYNAIRYRERKREYFENNVKFLIERVY